MAEPGGLPPAGRAGIVVLAGVNGAGKSSIAGETLRRLGGEYFNPDEHARRFRDTFPHATQFEANAYAWQRGKDALKLAIAQGSTFAFETTLGGDSITRILIEGATRNGAIVRVWYAGLESVQLHIQRVEQRVSRGGHDIDEADIRRRYPASHANLVRLIPYLSGLNVYDNSQEADPAAGLTPNPRLLLAFDHNGISFPTATALAAIPAWAKPIVMAAIKRFATI